MTIAEQEELTVIDTHSLVEQEELMAIDTNLQSEQDEEQVIIKHQELVELEVTEDGALRRYINYVSKLPILSKEEEERLMSLYLEQHDLEAGRQIILSHLRLAVKIGMQYRNYGLPITDVISEGNVGLMHALKKFDRSKGARFGTYASLWIRATIQDFIIRSWSIVKTGSFALRKAMIFNMRQIKQQLGIDSSLDSTEAKKRIANHLGVSTQEFEEAENAIRTRDSISLYGSDENNSYSVLDYMGSHHNHVAELSNEEDERIRASAMKYAMATLNDRERDIITSRYLSSEKTTLEELSIKYSVSKERIRQIEENGIKKMKRIANEYRDQLK